MINYKIGDEITLGNFDNNDKKIMLRILVNNGINSCTYQNDMLRNDTYDYLF